MQLLSLLLILCAGIHGLTLPLNPLTNFAVGPGSVVPLNWACVVNTSFSSITLDTSTNLINTGDYSAATNYVVSGPAGCSSSYVPYGTAAACNGATSLVVSQIDIRGSAYQVVSAFTHDGYNHAGSAVFSSNNQVVTISGGGWCGYECTTTADAAGEGACTRFGGWYLEVAPIRLTLNPLTNFAVGPGSVVPLNWACVVNTSYSSISYDPSTFMINTGDFSAATNYVVSGPAGCSASYVPYSTAAACNGPSSQVVSRIDLRGTPVKVASSFAAYGWDYAGSAVFSDNDQVVTISGGGWCGYEATSAAIAAGEGASTRFGGWYLQLAYV